MNDDIDRNLQLAIEQLQCARTTYRRYKHIEGARGAEHARYERRKTCTESVA